ncbi:MAG: YtxH domain-containing protein [Chloroflexota bacterium]|nr:YtxH domain-containing protein [Chloroflexota bacterium]
MPTGPASTADEIAETIRTLIDRVTDAKVTQEMAKRGQGVAGLLAERGAGVGDRASEVWRESRPLRRDAAKRASQMGGEAARWSELTWRSSLRPLLKDLWKRRTVAIGAAGAAVPAGKELVDSAAARLGIRERREQRHWGAFFLGLVLGAAAGAIAALLTAPKRGSEIRHDLSVKADEVRTELNARARDTEWVPIFQRDETTNGSATDTFPDASGSVQEAAADAGTSPVEPVEPAASIDQGTATDPADTMREPTDIVDRETRP